MQINADPMWLQFVLTMVLAVGIAIPIFVYRLCAFVIVQRRGWDELTMARNLHDAQVSAIADGVASLGARDAMKEAHIMNQCYDRYMEARERYPIAYILEHRRRGSLKVLKQEIENKQDKRRQSVDLSNVDALPGHTHGEKATHLMQMEHNLAVGAHELYTFWERLRTDTDDHEAAESADA